MAEHGGLLHVREERLRRAEPVVHGLAVVLPAFGEYRDVPGVDGQVGEELLVALPVRQVVAAGQEAPVLFTLALFPEPGEEIRHLFGHVREGHGTLLQDTKQRGVGFAQKEQGQQRVRDLREKRQAVLEIPKQPIADTLGGPSRGCRPSLQR